MINYQIVRVDPSSLSVQIRYSKEGFPDYFLRSYVGKPFNQEAVKARAEAENNILHVTNYWDNIPKEDVSIEKVGGQIKETIEDPKPDYREGVEKLSPVLSEEDGCIRKSWDVVALSEDELATAIRKKRNILLAQTDPFALSDRILSPEMAAYREGLRHITAQDGFPFDIEWPVMPVD